MGKSYKKNHNSIGARVTKNYKKTVVLQVHVLSCERDRESSKTSIRLHVQQRKN